MFRASISLKMRVARKAPTGTDRGKGLGSSYDAGNRRKNHGNLLKNRKNRDKFLFYLSSPPFVFRVHLKIPPVLLAGAFTLATFGLAGERGRKREKTPF